jgi:hypothetical protein
MLFWERLYGRYNPAKSTAGRVTLTNMGFMTTDEIESMVKSFMGRKSRSLTPQQLCYVVECSKEFPIPLYVQMACNSAESWSSSKVVPSLPPSKTDIQRGESVKHALEKDTETMFIVLLEKLEKRYGYMLVSRALGYLTVAKRGLSTLELEDVLSLDDDVLNKVFQVRLFLNDRNM